MPRARQQGEQGKAYANRTDLNAASTPKTVPGQEYGQQTAQMNGMAQAPVAQGGESVVAPASRQPQPAQTPAPTKPPVTPGSLPYLDHPTERPNEPLLPVDDGVTRNMIAGQQRQAGIADLFSNLASAPGAPHELQSLALIAKRMTDRG